MKKYTTAWVLNYFVDIANEKKKAPPFDEKSENILFWSKVSILQDEGYLTNVLITKGNMGQPVGITIFSPQVLTIKGEEYLKENRQKVWWRRWWVWGYTAIGAIVFYVIKNMCYEFITELF